MLINLQQLDRFCIHLVTEKDGDKFVDQVERIVKESQGDGFEHLHLDTGATNNALYAIAVAYKHRKG